ncbi:MAG: histidine phosphatase family protein [Rhodospirillales bacterium]|nr:histidine phosphatase family protein [Rhodospirillales bacterium]
MRQLLLLRHAKAVPSTSDAADHARPLAPRGRADAALLRAAMRARGLVPEIVLVSSARRALQTLEALEPFEDMPLIEPMDSLYMAGPEQIIDALRQLGPTVRSVMVVGHNPGLHETARLLADGAGGEAEAAMRASYPTACLTEFTIPGGWDALAPGSARLRLFLPPRALAGA